MFLPCLNKVYVCGTMYECMYHQYTQELHWRGITYTLFITNQPQVSFSNIYFVIHLLHMYVALFVIEISHVNNCCLKIYTCRRSL